MLSLMHNPLPQIINNKKVKATHQGEKPEVNKAQ